MSGLAAAGAGRYVSRREVQGQVNQVCIGIGSNEGDRRGYLELARRGLAAIPGSWLVAFSRIYETPPVGPMPQAAYLNAAAALSTELSPHELLTHLRAIEADAGRPPLEQRLRWGPRTLDLDILLYGDRVVTDEGLVIPHPMMHDRWFVLKPLADVAAEMVHPKLKMTVADLLARIERQGGEVGRAIDDTERRP